MLLQECVFVPRSKGLRTKEKLEDEVQGLVGSWAKNGQVWGDNIWGWKNNRLVVSCWTPCSDSLDEKYASEWVQHAFSRVLNLCDRRPTFKVVAKRGSEVRAKSWKKQSTLYLFTHMFDDTSPVCGGRTGIPVPLYLMSVDQKLRQDLVAWMGTYKDLDSLWIGSGSLMEAYRELAQPDSVLSQEGQKLAKKVEEATALPTYYYLMRYWGRAQHDGSPREAEIKRKCPGCGRKWKRRDREARGLGWFDYRCDRCRLVSHLAVSFEDARRARIGEWKHTST